MQTDENNPADKIVGSTDGLATVSQAKNMSERRPFNVRCGACGHVWTAAYTPMGMTRLGKVLKGIHCPACGEPSKNIFLVMANYRLPVPDKDDPG